MKNKMMRLASCLLVAVLLTSSIVSGTFAKYVTSATSTDTARVARWGFDATTIDIEDLFAATYNNVASNNGDDVIAPGTSGSSTIWFTTESGAAPEVAYEFKVSATTTAEDGNTILSNKNIQWAFYKEDTTTPTYGTFEEMITAINAMSVDKVQAKTLPELSGKYVIAWQWIFATDTEHDVIDTDMGNAGSGLLTELEKIDLTITITATQLD